MFGAKYSRAKFWMISTPLLFLAAFTNGFGKIFASIEGAENPTLFIYLAGILITLTWINTLANRIRDYGSNPWLSFLVLIPLVNIGMALYYGIVQYKEKPMNGDATVDNSNSSLVKAVYNHTKDIAAEVKPAISEYKQKHTSSQIQVESQDVYSVDDDKVYEQVILEIEEDKKVKATWARALSQADGDKDKAEALYIQFRVKTIVAEKQEINEQQFLINKKLLEQAQLEKEKMDRKRAEQKKQEDVEDMKIGYIALFIISLIIVVIYYMVR
jgi:hypothetical protein